MFVLLLLFAVLAAHDDDDDDYDYNNSDDNDYSGDLLFCWLVDRLGGCFLLVILIQ